MQAITRRLTYINYLSRPAFFGASLFDQAFSTDIQRSYNEMYKNKWKVYDPTHERSLATHKSNAEMYIHKVPVIEVDADVVRCMGGTDINVGHPQVYIQLNTRKDGTPQTCKYCGLKYVRKLHHHH